MSLLSTTFLLQPPTLRWQFGMRCPMLKQTTWIRFPLHFSRKMTKLVSAEWNRLHTTHTNCFFLFTKTKFLIYIFYKFDSPFNKYNIHSENLVLLSVLACTARQTHIKKSIYIARLNAHRVVLSLSLFDVTCYTMKLFQKINSEFRPIFMLHEMNKKVKFLLKRLLST